MARKKMAPPPPKPAPVPPRVAASVSEHARVMAAWYELNQWIHAPNASMPADLRTEIDRALLADLGRALEALTPPMSLEDVADHIAEGREAVADQAADLIEDFAGTVNDGDPIDTEALSALAERVRALGVE